jgi:hypothetical protein
VGWQEAVASATLWLPTQVLTGFERRRYTKSAHNCKCCWNLQVLLKLNTTCPLTWHDSCGKTHVA